MLAEDLECAVCVADVSPAAELVLVVLGVGDAAAGEAVDDEGRDAEGGEFARPVVLQARRAARAVKQDHGRQPVGAGAWDAEVAADGRRLGVLLTGQELLLGRGLGLDRVQLESCNLPVSRAHREDGTNDQRRSKEHEAGFTEFAKKAG